MNKKMEASQATIGQLIAVSRTLFAQKGYNQTSLEEIVDQIDLPKNRRNAWMPVGFPNAAAG